jgi:aquaporin Z
MLVMGLVFSIGQVSGAHFNPAVSVAFSLRFAFHWWRLLYYIPAQFVGALVIFVTHTTTRHDTRPTTPRNTRHTRHETYIAAGAMLGSLVVMGFLGTEGDVGASLPQGMTIQAALGLEIAFSSIFLFVVLNVAERAKVVGANGAIAVGVIVTALGIVGGYFLIVCVSCVVW